MDEDSPLGMYRIGSPPPAPSSHWVRWAWLAGVALLLATGSAWAGIGLARKDASVAASASSSVPPRMQVFRVFGYFDLGDDADGAQFEWSDTTNTCWGRGGYSDIREGTPVVVTDAAGTTVAVGKLGPGKPKGSNGRADSCTFAWEVLGVPDGSAFYAVEVSHRGKIQRPRDQMTVRFDLGFS